MFVELGGGVDCKQDRKRCRRKERGETRSLEEEMGFTRLRAGWRRGGVQAAPGGEENGEMRALGVGWEEKGALHAWCRVHTVGGGGEWCLTWGGGEGWR